MFHAASGGKYIAADEGVICTTTVPAPDELRVVFESALATSTAYVRVLTAGVANDVHDYHNRALLAQRVVASVTDGGGTVAATDIDVQSVSVATGTYAAYKLTLARAVTPSEVVGVTVQSPYVRGTLATTADLAPLAAAMPRLEVSVARPLLSFAPWAPSAAAGVTAPALASAHALVVGAAVTLHFAFEAQEDFPAGAAASFAATVNGAELPLGDATVSAKSLVVSFEAASAAKHTFVFVAFGTMFVFVVDAARVYSFPAIVSTSRSAKPVVTLGEQLPVVSTFDAALPPGMTASAVVTALGFEAEAASYVGALSGSTVGFSVLVARDVAHSATVTLSYGGTSRGGYSWGSGALTAASIYTFPSSFTIDGSANGFGTPYKLRVGAAGSLTLTFAEGDMLHSSEKAAQIGYVMYTQGDTTTTVPIDSLECSAPLETVTIASLAPANTGTLRLRVQLKGPDGAPSAEMFADVSSAQISPAWEAVAVTTASVPAPHTLVVGSSVNLEFAFTAPPGASFTATLNGTPLPTTSVVGTCVTAPYMALSATEHVFVFTALGQSVQFVVPASAVFAFPALVSTSRGTAEWISVGRPVTLVTTFANEFPPTATATAVLRPGSSSLPYAGSVSENAVSVTFAASLEYYKQEVTGSIFVAYGACMHEYPYEWDAQYFYWYLYRFPDTFSILSGTLQVGWPSALSLSMVGNGWSASMHTQTTADQFVYVRYTQGGVTAPVPLASVTCEDWYYTLRGIVALNNASDLTLTLKLKGPDGTEGPEITCVVPSADIVPERPNVSWIDGATTYRIGGDGLFMNNNIAPYATGAWVSNVAYSVWMPVWDSWMVVYVSMNSLKYGNVGVAGDVHTVASIQTGAVWQFPWTGKLLTDIPWDPVAVTTERLANVSWRDDGDKKIVANQLFVTNLSTPLATGAWVGNFAYAAFVTDWNGWLLVQFTSDTVRTGFHNGPDYVPTVASILVKTLNNNQHPWTGNLPVLPFGHTLVVGSPVDIYVGFTELPSAITSAASFTVMLNGTTLSPLQHASLEGTSLMIPYTALDAVEHVFTLVALGQSKQFVVPASAVFTFPTVGTTTMSPPYVTLGESAELTTTFASAFPSSATATTVVTPEGQSATSPLVTTLSGLSAVVSHTVGFDALHAGAITVTYGPASKVYSWQASPLTAGSIYTFPSSFTFVPSNAYGAGLHLKETNLGSLQLTFVGGDLLHSASAAAQVSYVTYTQGTTSPAVVGALTLPDTVAISLTPVDTTALTLSVQLKGPDGAPGGVMTAIVPSEQVAAAAPVTPAWAPTAAAGVSVTAGSTNLVAGTTVQLRFAFTAPETFPTNAAASFSARANGVVLSLASAAVSGKALILSFTPPGPAMGYTFTFLAFGRGFMFTLLAPAYWSLNPSGVVGTTTISGSSITLRTAESAVGFMLVKSLVHTTKSVKISWTGFNYGANGERASGYIIDDGMLIPGTVLGGFLTPSGSTELLVSQDLGLYIDSNTVSPVICQTTYTLEFDMTDVHWHDDYPKRIVGNLFYTHYFYDEPWGFAVGAWVSNYAYAVRILQWDGWLLVQFTSDTVRAAWRSGDPGYVPTVESILAATQNHQTSPWTGTLQYRFA
jgi:hypothetical protein